MGMDNVLFLTCRWDTTQDADMDNLVLLTFDEADAHDEHALDDLDNNFRDYVEQRLKVVRVDYRLGTAGNV